MHAPPPSPARSPDPFALAAASMIVVLGFLPVANWITGGHRAPWYGPVATTWITGSALAIGLGLVLAIASRRIPALWHDGLGTRLAVALDRSPVVMLVALTIVSTVVYATIAHLVFDARPSAGGRNLPGVASADFRRGAPDDTGCRAPGVLQRNAHRGGRRTSLRPFSSGTLRAAHARRAVRRSVDHGSARRGDRGRCVRSSICAQPNLDRPCESARWCCSRWRPSWRSCRRRT